MRPFESTEYSLLMSGSLNRFGRGLNNSRFQAPPFSHHPGKKPMLYMVPTTPSKPAFFMQPNNYRPHPHPPQPPQTSPAASTFLNHDFARYGCSNNHMTSNSFNSSFNPNPNYANKCERFPTIPTPYEAPNKPWYVSEESYLDENARHARKLLNEIDIKTKMKKYDANELFNTEILEDLETKPKEMPPAYVNNNNNGTCDLGARAAMNVDRKYPHTSLGLRRSNSSLPSRYPPFQQSQLNHQLAHNKRLSNFYLDDNYNASMPLNNNYNLNNYPIDNSYLEDVRAYF